MSSNSEKAQLHPYRAPSLPELLAPLNSILAPMIRAGLGSPLAFTPGVTLLEVAGRKSGKLRSTPLTCYLAGTLIIIGTVRPGAQWMQNLRATDDIHVWLWGQRWQATKHHASDHVALLSFRPSARQVSKAHNPSTHSSVSQPTAAE